MNEPKPCVCPDCAELVRRNRAVWDAFRNSKDRSGNLSHPYADALRELMGALMMEDTHLAQMQDGPRKLKLAYKKALDAHHQVVRH